MDDPNPAVRRNGSAPLHWLLIDIPPHIKMLAESCSSKGSCGGIEPKTYGGMCPPKPNVNLYRFTLFARSVETTHITADLTNGLAVSNFLLSDGNTVAIGVLQGAFPPL